MASPPARGQADPTTKPPVSTTEAHVSQWRLDEEVRVGPISLRGRVYLPAHQPGLAEGGRVSERYIAYHRQRAKAGVAMQVTGATPVDIAAAHVNNPVPPLPDTVDVQLREFVMSMLAKDPLDRPKDALVVSRTLSRIERRLLDQQTQLADTMVVSSGGRLPRRVVSKPHISVSNDWKEQG